MVHNINVTVGETGSIPFAPCPVAHPFREYSLGVGSCSGRPQCRAVRLCAGCSSYFNIRFTSATGSQTLAQRRPTDMSSLTVNDTATDSSSTDKLCECKQLQSRRRASAYTICTRAGYWRVTRLRQRRRETRTCSTDGRLDLHTKLTPPLTADIYVSIAAGVFLLLALTFFMWWSGCWWRQHRCTIHKRRVKVVKGDGTQFPDGGGMCTGGRSVICSRPDCQEKWDSLKRA